MQDLICGVLMKCIIMYFFPAEIGRVFLQWRAIGESSWMTVFFICPLDGELIAFWLMSFSEQSCKHSVHPKKMDSNKLFFFFLHFNSVPYPSNSIILLFTVSMCIAMFVCAWIYHFEGKSGPSIGTETNIVYSWKIFLGFSF